MIVISDATPLIAMAILGRFELLRQLFGEIIIPPRFMTKLPAGALVELVRMRCLEVWPTAGFVWKIFQTHLC